MERKTFTKHRGTAFTLAELLLLSILSLHVVLGNAAAERP